MTTRYRGSARSCWSRGFFAAASTRFLRCPACLLSPRHSRT